MERDSGKEQEKTRARLYHHGVSRCNLPIPPSHLSSTLWRLRMRYSTLQLCRGPIITTALLLFLGHKQCCTTSNMMSQWPHKSTTCIRWAWNLCRYLVHCHVSVGFCFMEYSTHTQLSVYSLKMEVVTSLHTVNLKRPSSSVVISWKSNLRSSDVDFSCY